MKSGDDKTQLTNIAASVEPVVFHVANSWLWLSASE